MSRIGQFVAREVDLKAMACMRRQVRDYGERWAWSYVQMQHIASQVKQQEAPRSGGSRRPPAFRTVSSRSCTRSNVVNRAPQAVQDRRRRIAVLSSVGLESFTWVSSDPQNGHFIYPLPAGRLLTRINRKLGAKLAHFLSDAGFDRRIVITAGRQPIENLHDHLADLPELRLTETACGRCR